MGKFTGKPNQFDGKNHGFPVNFPLIQSSESESLWHQCCALFCLGPKSLPQRLDRAGKMPWRRCGGIVVPGSRPWWKERRLVALVAGAVSWRWHSVTWWYLLDLKWCLWRRLRSRDVYEMSVGSTLQFISVSSCCNAHSDSFASTWGVTRFYPLE